MTCKCLQNKQNEETNFYLLGSNKKAGILLSSLVKLYFD